MLHEVDNVTGQLTTLGPFGRLSAKIRSVRRIDSTGAADAVEDLGNEEQGQLNVDHGQFLG